MLTCVGPMSIICFYFIISTNYMYYVTSALRFTTKLPQLPSCFSFFLSPCTPVVLCACVCACACVHACLRVCVRLFAWQNNEFWILAAHRWVRTTLFGTELFFRLVCAVKIFKKYFTAEVKINMHSLTQSYLIGNSPIFTQKLFGDVR